MKKRKIIEHKNVVGCNIDGTIYVHPKLKEKPKLYAAIIKHEEEHTDSFEKHDIIHDIINGELHGVRGEYWKFVITHPSTWVSFLPIMRINKQWVFDIVMTLFWFMIALIIGFGVAL